MSNAEADPSEIVCGAVATVPPVVGIEVLEPRPVPLGGPRAMGVRRTLPQRQRSLIGAWCFLDHYGPEDVRHSGGMDVPPHPHTGLQTVSWLFSGEVEHRDSAGNHAFVRPGELNLMTAGSGISHSERSTAPTTILHGVQLWVALPASDRFVARTFEHHAPPEVTGPGWRARVFLGRLLGSMSPVHTHSPLVGAELNLLPETTLRLDVDAGFEHGVLVDSGQLRVDGQPVVPAQLAYRAAGGDVMELRSGPDPVRLLILGGPPFGEQVVMWWNFLGRTHEEIETFRRDWQAEIDGISSSPGSRPVFGLPQGDPGAPLPAPPLPNARLLPRS